MLSKIPISVMEPTYILRSQMLKWSGFGEYPNKLKIATVNRSKVRETVLKLSNSTSMGLHKIPMKILKDGLDVVDIHIMRILSLSIITSTFPIKWKIGKIIPLYKGDDYDCEDKASYRPVCILSSLSKVVEKVIAEQIVEHMEDNGLFHPCQFAYRKGLSNVDAMTLLHEQWMDSIDKKEQSILISIDMSSAFDMVEHSILAEKLKIYGLDEDGLKWINSYFKYRSQYVTVDKNNSERVWIKNGVPQGSILGPILYLIYMNEIPGISNIWCTHDVEMNDTRCPFGEYCTKCGVTSCYADDSNYTISGKDSGELLYKVTRVITIWQNFCNSNRLCMNDKKTAMMRLITRKQLQVNPPERVIWIFLTRMANKYVQE